MIYIRKNTFIPLSNELDSRYFKVGKTWEDYLSGCYILLSDEQEAWYLNNSNSSVSEVWNMAKNIECDNDSTAGSSNSLKLAKEKALRKLLDFDNNNINNFLVNINGEIIKTWLSVQERVNYRQSIEVAKLLENSTLSFYIEDHLLEVSTTKAESMLVQIQLYADQSFLVTKGHELAIKNLESIDEVESYDFKTGYPNKLSFVL